jgi:hypothetical protein
LAARQINGESQAMYLWHIRVTETAFAVHTDIPHVTGYPDSTDAVEILINTISGNLRVQMPKPYPDVPLHPLDGPAPTD